jgi:ketosteroid isomerase-like protein
MSADTADASADDLLRRLEDQRTRALQGGDVAALAQLLDPGFVYVHASGRTETRSDYLASIADQRTRYAHFVHRDTELRLLGGAALMGGVLSHSKTVGGVSRSLLFRFTAIWASGEDAQWRLLRWHNTKIVPLSVHHADADPVHGRTE